MINNYKAQRNVRAELGGAVDLGHPVALYIKEDEVKYGSKNLILNGSFTDNVDNWTNSASRPWDSMVASDGQLSAVVENGGGYASILSNKITFKKGSQYQIKYTATKTSGDTLKVNVHPNISITDSSNGGSMYGEEISGTETNTAIFTATHTEGYVFLWVNAGSDSDSVATLDNVSVYEVTDHSYKLMAINDTIPSGGINVEALGSELGTNGTFESNADNWVAKDTTLAHETSAPITGSGSIKSTNSASSGGPYQNMSLSSSKNYRVTGKMKLLSGSSNGRVTIYTSRSNGTGQEGAYEGSSGELVSGGSELAFDVVISPTESDRVSIQFAVQVSDGVFLLDDVSVKEVYGYDYYNAPAYKFGIVSSVYDQSTGAMKTTGVAGDEVDVTVQGECNLIRPSGNNVGVVKDYVITKIGSTGNPTDSNPATEVDGGHQNIPNSVGVITETNSSSETAKAILFQGVEFSEHFVHKNSLQVMAKCDETITKFRPVSLYLDSEGDLLCRHDDIPAKAPDADTDHTGVDPGKWGISELGGVSGDIIPVTVAGKTHINTSFNLVEGAVIRQIREDGGVIESSNYSQYAPNALGTTLKTGNGDIPITIFQGTPIGTITDWKRTIKVTAKANGAITQYCPVSLYLDQYGNYKCIADDIPNSATDTSNGIWCDFRKWGIAQETVADGENVEIIVQGRTNVVNSLSGANREEFVLKISSSGGVTSGAHGSTAAFALSSLGIVEKEARTSNGTPGTIIIF